MSIKPKKLLGQHFLTNTEILKHIVSASHISKNEVVVEVGPGTGTLTEQLLPTASKLIAVEKDRELIQGMQEKFKTKVTIVHEDILKFLPEKYIPKNKKYIVVGNIPYYLTSRLIRYFLSEVKHKPIRMILMVQKEVAQRILAQPPQMNLLGLSVQIYGAPKIIMHVSRKNFLPQPKVDSTVITIENISDEFFMKHKIDEKKFFILLKSGFSSKRKKLTNNLKNNNTARSAPNNLENICSINQNARAQELSIPQWICLYHQIYKK